MCIHSSSWFLDLCIWELVQIREMRCIFQVNIVCIRVPYYVTNCLQKTLSFPQDPGRLIFAQEVKGGQVCSCWREMYCFWHLRLWKLTTNVGEVLILNIGIVFVIILHPLPGTASLPHNGAFVPQKLQKFLVFSTLDNCYPCRVVKWWAISNINHTYSRPTEIINLIT